MSTTDSASATIGPNNHTQVTRSSSPSSTPARNSEHPQSSQVGSNRSGSNWSAEVDQSRSPPDPVINAATLRRNDTKSDRAISNTYERRGRHRSSGGFLLDSITHSSRLSRTLVSGRLQDPKGKRKSDSSELSTYKGREKRSVLEQDASHKGSPLSLEVRRDQQRSVNNNEFEATKDDEGHSLGGHSGTASSRRSGSQSVNLDADAAQIVDMALQLSEARRRQVSGMRLTSGSATGKRVVSTTSHRQIATPTKSPGHRGDTSRSRPDFSVSNTFTLQGGPDENSDAMKVDGSSSPLGQDQNAFDMSEVIEISRATAARVEKARIYLELAYEHRRILSHLPPVRRPTSQAKENDTGLGGKNYNPLQYARNRKLRIREKTAINAEADGWHDIEKVRAWVDAVVNSRTETSHDPLECVRLPPLSLREKVEEGPRSPGLPNSLRSPRAQPIRPRRPKSDWVTHPGDLLADAFWLEQGLNKTKIQDRDNRSVYPANTPFRFSGWRNRTPGDIPERLQQPSPPPEEVLQQETTIPLAAAPELPTFRSANKNDREGSRGRKRPKLKGVLTKPRSGSGKRKTALLDSSSDSSSDSDVSSPRSDSRGVSRGRKHNIKKFNLPDGDPFGNEVSTVNRDAKVNGALTLGKNYATGSDSKRSSVDLFRFPNHLRVSSTAKSVSRDRSRARDSTSRRHFFHRSKDSVDQGQDDSSSIEDISLVPRSARYSLPSIAINLDPPVSRSPSPTKKSRSTLFPLLKDRSKLLEHDKVETNDFANWNLASPSRGTSQDVGPHCASSNETSRGTSPFTRGTSPSTKLKREPTTQDDFISTGLEHRNSSASRISTRPVSIVAQDQPSRIRGMFKGGRIAELVGNEVSRMGDFIWKRDVPAAYRHHASESEASFRSHEPSDTDEDSYDSFLGRHKLGELRPSTSTLASGSEQGSPVDRKSAEKPVLHNPNLPSFTSPFQRDREKQDKKQEFLSPGIATGSDDPISKQVAQHRDRSKSPRLGLLAPPKLDTAAPRSVGVERKNSYGFGDAMGRSQSASRAFNNVINTKSGASESTRTSNAGLIINPRQTGDNTSRNLRPNGMRKRDLQRIQALLLISTVKAKNINNNANQIPPMPSNLLLKTTKTIEAKNNAFRTRRRDEHVIAAQNLVVQLNEHTIDINNRLQAFSSNKAAQLHQEIQAIEDQIENQITPRVRSAADSAGELGVMLTTKSTQAVKGMHDTVSEAFRLRRRGPSRWLRLFGYTLMEWAVVGLLWFIWAVVSFVRGFIGFFRVTGKAIRWLFWID